MWESVSCLDKIGLGKLAVRAVIGWIYDWDQAKTLLDWGANEKRAFILVWKHREGEGTTGNCIAQQGTALCNVVPLVGEITMNSKVHDPFIFMQRKYSLPLFFGLDTNNRWQICIVSLCCSKLKTSHIVGNFLNVIFLSHNWLWCHMIDCLQPNGCLMKHSVSFHVSGRWHISQ